MSLITLIVILRSEYSTVKKTKLNGDYAKRNVLFFVLFLITSSLIFVGGIEEQEKPSKLNAMTMQKEMLFFFFFFVINYFNSYFEEE